jgi:hypothetical protein
MTVARRTPRRFTAVLATWGLAVALTAAGSAAASAAPRPAVTGLQISDDLSSVSCLSASWCMAVGSTGVQGGSDTTNRALAQLWNGHTWTVLPVPQPASPGANLAGVSCLSRVRCIAVGGQVTPAQMLAEEWNGSTWQMLPVPSTVPPMGALACVSGSKCLAVGSYGQSVSARWDGTTWRGLKTPDPGGPQSGLNGVSCPSATDCVAVGQAFTNNTSTQEIADQWNGHGWRVMKTPPVLQFDYNANAVGVSCAGTSWCMAVGEYDPPSAMMWTGHGAWQQLTLPAGTGELLGVSCVSTTWCMAVGQDSTQSVPTAIDWNGSTWQWLNPVNPGSSGTVTTGLSGVWCGSADTCLAVGQYAVNGAGNSDGDAEFRLAQTWNGSTWQVPAPHGYLVGLTDGGVASLHVSWYGSELGSVPSAPVGLAADPATGGYWIANADGAMSNDNAPWCGSQRWTLPTGVKAVAIAADPVTGGYWMLDSDGGIGNFNAPAQGSELGNVPSPPDGLAADPATGGYWILNADGAVSNDDAPWHGSQRGTLPTGVKAVAIAADPVTDGYWILDSNGDVGNFDAPSYGSELGHLTSAPAGIAADPATGGYWIVNASGSVTAFHAPSYGSASGGTPDAIAGL